MQNTVIVTGPQGCGKSLHRAALLRSTGCNGVVDEWWPGDPLVPGALHLTHATLAGQQYGPAKVLQFGELMASA